MRLLNRPEKPGISRTKSTALTAVALIVLKIVNQRFGLGLPDEYIEEIAAALAALALIFLRDAVPE